ncbi:MAG: DinB family protein [Longimicrobiales bacterium]|nr:DinB family protein [Longimicrobiales bacterium]
MNRMLNIASCLVLFSAGPALAQEQAPPMDTGPRQMQDSQAVVGSVAPLYAMVKGYIIAAAEQMPEDKYGYRPTPEVRTFGQIVGHVAMAQYWFCNGAVGEGPEPANYEELTDKAGLVEAIKTAFEHCAPAYAMNDAKAMEQVELWGETGTRLWVLNFNMAHAWEHYGNLVTYMRANGLVPPSSQGGM